MTRILLCLAVLAFFASTASAQQEPGWEGQVIARGARRAEIQSTDILYRPYRPLHFYGNATRRRYYRGSSIPMPRDLFRGGAAFVRR